MSEHFGEHLADILLAMVKPKFEFFQVKAKQMPVDATETCKPRFGEGPRGAFEPVDARVPAGKLVVAVFDPEVFPTS